MATKDVSAVDDTDGSGLRVAVVRTRWNPEIIGRLADGVARTLAGLGVTDVADVEVAGAFEIPFACRTIASSGRVDAIVAIGAVIRGETTHYDIVSEECARSPGRADPDRRADRLRCTGHGESDPGRGAQRTSRRPQRRRGRRAGGSRDGVVGPRLELTCPTPDCHPRRR